MHIPIYRFWAGDCLPDVLLEAKEQTKNLAEKVKFPHAALVNNFIVRLISMVMGLTQSEDSFESPEFNEKELEKKLKEMRSDATELWYLAFKVNIFIFLRPKMITK